MPNSPKPIRVLAITPNPLVSELIKTALEREVDYLWVESKILEEDLMEGVVQAQPDYILVDYLLPGANPVDFIDSVSLQFPEIVTIALLPEAQVSEANRVILAGARAFIIEPFDQKQLLATLGRVTELQVRNQQARAITEKEETTYTNRGTFVVFSPKGGVGCSWIALNLAIALREQSQQDVLLMDGKLLFGDLDIMLNLKTQNSIADLIPHIGALDDALIRDVISDHVSGIKVLPSPANPASAQGIHPEELHHILSSTQNIFPSIIIDSGNYLNDNTVTFMDASQKILLVINPDIACLRDASRFFDICRTTLSFPKDKILVIVNQYDQKDGLSLEDIEHSLHMKVFATIPWDRRTALQSINRGVPVVSQGQTPLRKAFEAMAKNIASLVGYKPTEIPGAKKILPDALSKSSRLG